MVESFQYILQLISVVVHQSVNLKGHKAAIPGYLGQAYLAAN